MNIETVNYLKFTIMTKITKIRKDYKEWSHPIEYGQIVTSDEMTKNIVKQRHEYYSCNYNGSSGAM